jgi:SAM-dependent methyltransferase
MTTPRVTRIGQLGEADTASGRKRCGRGFVREGRNRYWVDRRQKLGTIIPNEIILAELSELLDHEFRSAGDVSLLDLGAGTAPYAPLYTHYFPVTVSVDVPYSPHDVSHVDVSASADALPVDSGSFDFVLCTEVLEHCRDPGSVLEEIARVLKPGGWAFMTTPLMVGLHEQPHDYFRFTPFALQHVSEQAGLELKYVRPKGGYGAVLILLIQYPITKMWQALQKALRLPVYHPANPFLYFPVVLPQLAYIWLWKRLRTHRRLTSRRLSEALSRTTLGYVTVMRKPG